MLARAFSLCVGIHIERMLGLINSTVRGLSPRTPRGSGRIRRAVKGESPFSIRLEPRNATRPLTACRARYNARGVRGQLSIGVGSAVRQTSIESRRMKTTCRRAGREDGAPLRLDLKTKDLRWGLSAVFGFRLIAPQIRRRSPADLRFVGDRDYRLALVGVFRAPRRRAGAQGERSREEAHWNAAEALRALRGP
jgi:hypothetical protein